MKEEEGERRKEKGKTNFPAVAFLFPLSSFLL
jgi:hypothetical protein